MNGIVRIYTKHPLVIVHAPIAITYLGSCICSYILTKDGAIFMVMVPIIIIRSACLGLDLGTKL
jgi:hypothetical protein